MRGALVILLILGAELRAQCPDGSPPPCDSPGRVAPPAPAQRARSFMFLPFRNVTRMADHAWIVGGAPIMLGHALGQFRDIAVVGEERLSGARRRLRIPVDSVPDLAQVRTLAAATGGWTAVYGTVIANGPRLRITYQAVDVPTGRTTVRGERDVDAASDVRTAFDAIAVALLEPAGIPASGNSLAALTTRSVDAYRAYIRGVDHQNRSEFRQAMEAYSEAVRLDSTFALAWANLALIIPSVRGMQEMILPTSLIYRAIAEAGRNASRLPPLEAVMIRALQAFSRGQLRHARQILDSVVSQNPAAVGSMEMLATMYTMGVFVSQDTSASVMAADVNRAVDLARRALSLDPNRGGLYALPALIYGMAAGLFWGHTFSDTREFTSLPFMLLTVTSTPQARFVPLFGDSIYFMPADDFHALPAQERVRLRRPAADRGLRWVQEWLTVAPNDAEAHLWRSRIAELRGDPAEALQALQVADSLGIQSGMENATGRRLSLLLAVGKYEAAGALADSLLAAGGMVRPPFLASVDRRWTHGAAALLLARRWDGAGALARIVNARRRLPNACEAVGHEMAWSDAPVPEPIRRAIMDTVRAHLDVVQRHPELGACIRMLSTNLVPARP